MGTRFDNSKRYLMTWSAFIFALLLAMTTAPARAAVLVFAQDSTAPAGGTGHFDVVLQNSGASFQLSGFSIEPSTPAASSITLTSVTTATDAPYVFGTYQSAPDPFSFNTFPNHQFTASDADFTSPFFATVGSGQTLGLARVFYTVAPGASAGPVTVSLLSAGTNLSDVNGTAIPFTPLTGVINVAVPEPASLGFLAAMGITLLHRRRKS